MKKTLTFIFIILSFFSFSQKRDSLSIIEEDVISHEDSLNWYGIDSFPHWTSKYQTKFTSIDIIYRNKFYDADFRNQLPRVSNVNLPSLPYFIGIQNTTQLNINREICFSGTLSIEQMLPVNIQLNDSINAKLRGFNVGVPIFGFDALHKYRNIDFLIFSGVNIGRLKIYKKDYINKKNPYFLPKISLMPRIALGKIVLSATAEYDFDVFSTRWKNLLFEKKYSNTLSGFRQSGFSLIFGVGYKY